MHICVCWRFVKTKLAAAGSDADTTDFLGSTQKQALNFSTFVILQFSVFYIDSGDFRMIADSRLLGISLEKNSNLLAIVGEGDPAFVLSLLCHN